MNKLPDKPGVYLMKDAQNNVIYVGKALSLKNRVKSYFKDSDHSVKTRNLMKHFHNLEYMITDTEKEALILESTLIKKHKPRYNIRLKDDKKYPYIKITNEDYPRILITRMLKDDGARYFGPYTDAGAVRRTLKYIKSLFKIRDCKRMNGPCLNYQINLCNAPCTGKITKKEYQNLIDEVELFFEGKYTHIIKILKKRMVEASSNQEYERAGVIRDQIISIKDLMEKQKVSFTEKLDQDVIAISYDKEMAFVVVFSIRDGKIVGKDDFLMSGVENTSLSKILAAFLKQYYVAPRYVPSEIILQHEFDDEELILEWLTEAKGNRVNINIPKKGIKYHLLQMVAKNAEMVKNEKNEIKEALMDLKKYLKTSRIPKRIEAFDVSNIMGKFAVGSMVVFEDGIPKKSYYRRYKIKTKGPDDYAMMKEVLERRYKKLSQNQKTFPDLVMVDGGKGQVNIALNVFKSLGINVPVIGLAKEFERIFTPSDSEPIILSPDSDALHLLQRIRDESHRFAITYHRKLRSKDLNHSILEDIEGIGEKRKLSLLRHFGNVNEIAEATVDELIMVEGINMAIAYNIYRYFHKNQESN